MSQGTDTLSILTATGSLVMAKTWQADGEPLPYSLAKVFTLKKHPVSSIEDLDKALSVLAKRSQSCLIRGGYIGDDLAVPLMAADKDFKPGHVFRQDTVFKDRAMHSVMIDVDKFQPPRGYDISNPVPAIDEFIAQHLPPCFSGVSYRWQLSNSAGLTKHAATLKAHVWFWLDTAYTGAQLTAWTRAMKQAMVDEAVFRTVQPLYTADPVMAHGVVDPVPVRGGLVYGLFGDSVPLVIDDAMLTALPAQAADVDAELRMAVENDPVAQRLYERGMVQSKSARGRLNVVCPRQDLHTDGKTAVTACAYYPAFTNGYKQGNFKCMHSSCSNAPQHLFTQALGFSLTSADGFEDVADGAELDLFAAAVPKPAKRSRIAVPEAHHLCTDQANVQRLLKHFGKRLLVASDRWYAWDGARWLPDDAIATRYAMSLSKIIGQEALEWAAKKDESDNGGPDNAAIAKALRSWATKAEMRSSIDAALALAKRVLVVDAGMLDKDPWLLTCANGTVDLRTGKMGPHDPADYITKLCPVAYNENATAPSFTNVLLRVCCEEEGLSPVANFLQRWFGYCSTASTREQKFVVHYGQGSNGKSTILDIVSEVLGDYAATAAPGLLVAGGKDRHPTEIADLFGRRMVTAHESGEGGILREDFVKQATGGDRIKARYMRADFFEFSPTHKIQLLTNHKPTIKGQDHGIWRRVVMVPYKARFGTPEAVAIGAAQYVKERDVMERLRAENEGVLRWLVIGAVDWYRDGLNPPDYVLAASGAYQKEQDRILHFTEENCEMRHDYSAFLTTDMGEGLFQTYEAWCKEGGFFALSKPRFLQEIERLVPSFRKSEVLVRALNGKRRKALQIHGIRLME